MKTTLTKKLLTISLTAVILLNPFSLMAQDSKDANFVDDSLQDLTIVLASGAVGAVLGLSTLSFADKPKDHTKNIAIGGAIGIVVGVGLVIFNQATKPSVLTQTESLGTAESAESYARLDFSKQKIAESYLQQPTVGYNFTF